MTRSVYTLCGFQNLNPVGFCVVCAFCGIRLYLNVKQVEDSENIYGVLIVIVKDQQRQLLYK